jgi:hypothetical protein
VTQEDSLSKEWSDTEPEDESLLYVLQICEVNNYNSAKWKTQSIEVLNPEPISYLPRY